MNNAITFVQDLTYTLCRFIIEAFYIITSILVHVSKLVYKFIRVFYEDVLVPCFYQFIDVVSSLLNHLYEDVLLLTSITAIKIANFMVWLSRTCQELVKEHQRKRRWL